MATGLQGPKRPVKSLEGKNNETGLSSTPARERVLRAGERWPVLTRDLKTGERITPAW
jgi:hypothetical protein